MRVLYISPYVPYETIPHAGGFFFYTYLKGLSTTVQITILSPDTAYNREAVEQLDVKAEVLLVGQERMNSFIEKVLIEIPRNVVKPLYLSRWQEKAFIEHMTKPGFLGQFDLVELHWPQLLALVPSIKKINPHIPITAFEHDVFTQSVYRRAMEAATFSKNKLENILRSLRVKQEEKKALNQCKAIFCFSEKDKNLLKEMGVRPDVYPLAPSFEIPKETSSLEDGQRCLFVGALDRVENGESILWFIKKVWHKIVAEVPEAQLVIVGAHPSQELQALAGRDILITGFVEDLLPYYKEASVFMAPILTGAGVKFKVMQALAFGLPVVTTAVGAEGIDDKNEYGIFPAMTSDPEAFAQETIRLLKDANHRKSAGEKGRKWVEERYDFQKNTIEKALEVYHSLLEHVGTESLEEKI